jgi:hypothetical protein
LNCLEDEWHFTRNIQHTPIAKDISEKALQNTVNSAQLPNVKKHSNGIAAFSYIPSLWR